MNWTVWILLAVVVAGVLLLKRMSFISPDAARKHLQSGALVVDVRTPEEFRGGHLRGAVNVPLGELAEELPRQVKDRNQVLLLHCLSGGRSGIATRRLKSLGYPNSFNLGSYSRARQIVESSAAK
jgi:phage shock protein E